MRIKATDISASSSLRHLSGAAGALLAMIVIFAGAASGQAQNAVQPGYPGFYPTVTPGVQPSVSSYTPDYVPSFSPDFWKGQSYMQGLQAGTVLTGVLQDKLSSKSSKVGDVFSISLLEGYSEAGKELLPKGTKIVGAVTQVVSGQQSRSGQPGRIDISLQTLVLPDGRSAPIYAFIERNPNLEHQQDPNKQQKGLPLASYGQSMKNGLAGFANSITRRAVGMPLYYPGRAGHELSMEPGEVLPLRLNRPLDLPALLRQPVPGTTGQANPYASTPGMVSVPGLVDTEPPTAPSYQNQAQPPQVQDGGNPVVDDEPATKGIPDPF